MIENHVANLEKDCNYHFDLTEPMKETCKQILEGQLVQMSLPAVFHLKPEDINSDSVQAVMQLMENTVEEYQRSLISEEDDDDDDDEDIDDFDLEVRYFNSTDVYIGYKGRGILQLDWVAGTIDVKCLGSLYMSLGQTRSIILRETTGKRKPRKKRKLHPGDTNGRVVGSTGHEFIIDGCTFLINKVVQVGRLHYINFTKISEPKPKPEPEPKLVALKFTHCPDCGSGDLVGEEYQLINGIPTELTLSFTCDDCGEYFQVKQTEKKEKVV